MSETDDMWDRFFHGSKYEWKWRKRYLGPPSHGEISSRRETWLARLATEREAAAPTAVRENPFDRPARKDAA